jgi:hypothetical protein
MLPYRFSPPPPLNTIAYLPYGTVWKTYFWPNENGSHHQLMYHTFGFISYLPSLPFLVTQNLYKSSLLCYAVLEIVPVLVWQNMQSSNNSTHCQDSLRSAFGNLTTPCCCFPYCIARQALVLFFFLLWRK